MDKALDYKQALVNLWWEKAELTLNTANACYREGDRSAAINRVYYAALYAVSAWLVHKDRSHLLRKHSAVRAAVNRGLVKPGLIPITSGYFYNRVYDDREIGDYTPTADFSTEYTEEQIEGYGTFLSTIRSLLK